MLLTKRKRDNGEKPQEKEETKKVGTSIVLPIRQTASIFRQSVTVVRNHEKSQFHTEPIKGSQEKPKQVSIGLFFCGRLAKKYFFIC